MASDSVRLGVCTIVLSMFGTVYVNAATPHEPLSLNGVWQIAEGTMDAVPKQFDHQVPVPGLVDLATPKFASVGFETEANRAFWYRRTFTIEETLPEFALLKLHKAKYGLQVLVNGQVVGEHQPCFTPGYFDIRKALLERGETNEILIRVGAHRTSLPPSIPTGWDFEKYKYIPGIYDDVEILLAASPRIVNVQIVPDIDKPSVRIVTELESLQAKDSQLEFIVREVVSGRVIVESKQQCSVTADEVKTHSTEFPLEDCHLWTPEDPFLYELDVVTDGDRVTHRFGMRSFRFDPKTGRATLNGKPYFMRGTNVCILRFFEDGARENLPWDKHWVRRLHEKFKHMHWNSVRYCIGFPPDFWYDIADEVGILIQDEFPIWHLNPQQDPGGWPDELKADQLVREYTDWMRQRWNHPSVVIWDAQNETISNGETGRAIQQVRGLDLSNRPWDNGWEVHQQEGDPREAHPYLYIQYWMGKGKFKLSDLATLAKRPGTHVTQKDPTPIILNEYAWLWLNRDGTTTGLTHNVYKDLLGPRASIPEKRYAYARHLAALTEFWRSHRECAAVMHFCGLAYSRPGGIARPASGATSDHFMELESLNLEVNFETYVRDAFAPVGVMIDRWDPAYPTGEKVEIPVAVINDLPGDWKGTVRLLVRDKDEDVVSQEEQTVEVEGLGRTIAMFHPEIPRRNDRWQFVAELVMDPKTTVRSLRDFSSSDHLQSGRIN